MKMVSLSNVYDLCAHTHTMHHDISDIHVAASQLN